MTKTMANEVKKAFILFLLAQGIVYLFITLLSFVEGLWFVLVLLLMHGGIALFIYSKRLFHHIHLEVKHYYHQIYRLLALFLILLGYKIGSHLFGYDIHNQVKMFSTFSILLFVLIFAIHASKRFYEDLQNNRISRSA